MVSSFCPGRDEQKLHLSASQTNTANMTSFQIPSFCDIMHLFSIRLKSPRQLLMTSYFLKFFKQTTFFPGTPATVRQGATIDFSCRMWGRRERKKTTNHTWLRHKRAKKRNEVCFVVCVFHTKELHTRSPACINNRKLSQARRTSPWNTRLKSNKLLLQYSCSLYLRIYKIVI